MYMRDNTFALPFVTVLISLPSLLALSEFLRCDNYMMIALFAMREMYETLFSFLCLFFCLSFKVR